LGKNQQKRPSKGPFVLKPKSIAQPGLNGVGAMLCFPLFQRVLVAAFGFDDFAGVRFM
jgi:hypothetical protein